MSKRQHPPDDPLLVDVLADGWMPAGAVPPAGRYQWQFWGLDTKRWLPPDRGELCTIGADLGLVDRFHRITAADLKEMAELKHVRFRPVEAAQKGVKAP